MRYLLIILIQVTLFASSYDFDEHKYVSAAAVNFKKSGNISFENNKTIITYTKPQFKQITLDDNNVSIKGSSGKIIYLKGKPLFFTKLYITTMSKLSDFTNLKTNRDFDVIKQDNLYILRFKGDIKDQIKKAEVQTNNSKVTSFKLFFYNGDTLEIIKR